MKEKSHFRLIVLIVVALAALLFAPVALAQDSASGGIPGCPRSQGYWANHPEAWAVTSLMLGAQFYSQAELLAFMPGGGGDASTILAVQLVAAKLNIAAGVDGSPIAAAMLQADALLAQFSGKLPYNVSPSTPEGQAMVSLGGLLDIYNNGLLTPNCMPTPTPTSTPTMTPTAGPSPTPTATWTPGPSPTPSMTPTPSATPSGLPVTIIIEGPVTIINVNIITIWDIDIEIDINDPILGQIDVGDFVRIEGNLVGDSTTIVVVAVVVYIIDIDVVIGSGNVIIWEDDGRNCGNPPPPWAPAHGWRRRCQGQNPIIIITGGDDGMGMGMGDD